MAQGKKEEGAERSTWTVPDFSGAVRAKFAGCCKVLGKTQTLMCEEALKEWMFNHSEEFKRILDDELEALIKVEGVKYDG